MIRLLWVDILQAGTVVIGEPTFLGQTSADYMSDTGKIHK